MYCISREGSRTDSDVYMYCISREGNKTDSELYICIVFVY